MKKQHGLWVSWCRWVGRTVWCEDKTYHTTYIMWHVCDDIIFGTQTVPIFRYYSVITPLLFRFNFQFEPHYEPGAPHVMTQQSLPPTDMTPEHIITYDMCGWISAYILHLAIHDIALINPPPNAPPPQTPPPSPPPARSPRPRTRRTASP